MLSGLTPIHSYITVEGNAGDRNNLDPWHNGNELVQAVAKVNKNVIVVCHSVGPVILETILAQPNVKAVVWPGLPGQESGNALVDVLYGSTSPSGKLPYTIAKQFSDYGTDWTTALEDDFTEGLFIDYRHFDKNGITPRYAFGYGLCECPLVTPTSSDIHWMKNPKSRSMLTTIKIAAYTTFAYSSLNIRVTATPGVNSGPIIPGGHRDNFQSIGSITVNVANSGTVPGSEVAQLYIGLPASAPSTPPKQLRGFQKLPLAPGQRATATFPLTRRDIAYWDVGQKAWVVPSGTFKVFVGSSSRDIREQGSFTV